MSEINFENIYDKFVDRIYRFIFIKVNSRETAQDLTSETFTRAFEYWKQKGREKIENMQAFLFRTASNLVIDYYRQKSRQDISLDNSAGNFFAQTIASHAEHPEVSAAKNEAGQKIAAALRGLDSDYADIVMWHYIDDLSVREIAEITGRPEGTVRVMLHRGLQMLRKQCSSNVTI